jgi:SHS2 domain-containing protein
MVSRTLRTPIDHPADAGFKIKARSLRGLFLGAAEGLFELIGDPGVLRRLPERKAAVHRVISLGASGPGELLLLWLRELLYYFSAKRYFFLKYKIEKLGPDRLKIRASGVRFDPAKHEQRYEVKAVTYHGFRLHKTRMGWTAEIIFDL